MNRWARHAGILLPIVVTLSLVIGCPAPGGSGNGGPSGGGNDNGGGGGTGNAPGDGDGGAAPQPSNDPFPDSDEISALFQNPVTAYGKVELPDGFSLKASQLKLVTMAGETSPTDDGSYDTELSVLSGTRTLTAVIDSRRRVVLLGHIYPYDNSRNPINTESTAIALLYFALGGWTTPQDTFDEMYNTIKYDYSESVALITATLDEALADDPGALADGDERILNAIRAAQDSLLAQVSESLKTTAGPEKISTAHYQSSSAGGFITTSPGQTTAQNGVIMRSDATTGGLYALNQAPRRGVILRYQTGYESGGTRTDLSPVELVGGEIIVPSAYTTGTSNGLFSNIETQLDGGYPWKKIATEAFSLGMRDGASVTHYDLLLLSSTLDKTPSSTLFDDPKYVLEREGWRTRLDDLRAETFYIDYLIPVAETWAVGAGMLPDDIPDIPFIDNQPDKPDQSGQTTILGLPDTTRTAMLDATRALCDPVLTSGGINLDTASGYSQGLAAILNKAGTDATFRGALTDILYRAYGVNNTAFLNFSRMEQSLYNMATTFSLMASVQYGIGKVSLGSVTEQLQSSEPIAVWRATVSAVRLLPSKPVVTEKYPIERLVAQVNGSSDRQFCYRWSTTGRIGTLVGTETDDSGTAFSSSGDNVDYVADPGGISKTDDLDSVTVEVYDVTSAGGNGDCNANAASGVLIGSATATIEGDERDDACVATSFDPDRYNVPGPITLRVSPRTVLPGDTVTVTIDYDFSAAGADSSSSAGVNVYLPLGCSFCWNPERRCICTQEDRSTLRLDGQSGPPNVNTTEFVTGIGGDPADANFRPLRSTCLTGFSPLYFSLPDPDVREVVTHTIEYRISPDFHPCPLDRPDCFCPVLIQEPVYSSTGLVWSGPFVIAQAGSFSSGLAVELLNMGTDPSYDPETALYCPEEP